MLVDACPRCNSISNVVSDTRFRMKYKCNWCGERFVTPKKAVVPGPEVCKGCGAIEDACCTCDVDRYPPPVKKEAYWFDEKETED